MVNNLNSYVYNSEDCDSHQSFFKYFRNRTLFLLEITTLKSSQAAVFKVRLCVGISWTFQLCLPSIPEKFPKLHPQDSEHQVRYSKITDIQNKILVRFLLWEKCYHQPFSFFPMLIRNGFSFKQTTTMTKIALFSKLLTNK